MSTVILKRCPVYNFEEVYRAVGESVDRIGGISRFIKRGDKVLLKPNLLSANSPDKAVTTHPSIVEAVIRLVKDAGGSPFIGDSPGFGTAMHVASRCGIKEVADKHGIEIVDLNDPITVENSKGRTFRRFEVSQRAIASNAIINIPKFKTHAMMLLTLGVKNLFGCVPGRRKVVWHFEAGHSKETFAQMLVELYHLLNPALTILDGIVAMEGNGPGSGTPRKTGIIALSEDAVSLDTLISTMIGIDPLKVPTNAAARELNIGESSPDKILVEGDAAGLIFENFALPDTVDPNFVSRLPSFIKDHINKAITTRPSIDFNICKQCAVCVSACPPKAMKIDGKLTIDQKACIHCYCCHELCPEKAVYIKKGWALKLLT